MFIETKILLCFYRATIREIMTLFTENVFFSDIGSKFVRMLL